MRNARQQFESPPCQCWRTKHTYRQIVRNQCFPITINATYTANRVVCAKTSNNATQPLTWFAPAIPSRVRLCPKARHLNTHTNSAHSPTPRVCVCVCKSVTTSCWRKTVSFPPQQQIICSLTLVVTVCWCTSRGTSGKEQETSAWTANRATPNSVQQQPYIYIQPCTTKWMDTLHLGRGNDPIIWFCTPLPVSSWFVLTHMEVMRMGRFLCCLCLCISSIDCIYLFGITLINIWHTSRVQWPHPSEHLGQMHFGDAIYFNSTSKYIYTNVVTTRDDGHPKSISRW